MEIGELLKLLGDPGKYQVLFWILLWVCNSTISMNHLIMSVFGAPSPHRYALVTSLLFIEEFRMTC